MSKKGKVLIGVVLLAAVVVLMVVFHYMPSQVDNSLQYTVLAPDKTTVQETVGSER